MNMKQFSQYLKESSVDQGLIVTVRKIIDKSGVQDYNGYDQDQSEKDARREEEIQSRLTKELKKLLVGKTATLDLTPVDSNGGRGYNKKMIAQITIKDCYVTTLYDDSGEVVLVDKNTNKEYYLNTFKYI